MLLCDYLVWAPKILARWYEVFWCRWVSCWVGINKKTGPVGKSWRSLVAFATKPSARHKFQNPRQ
jgi:hypothetical protein